MHHLFLWSALVFAICLAPYTIGKFLKWQKRYIEETKNIRPNERLAWILVGALAVLIIAAGKFPMFNGYHVGDGLGMTNLPSTGMIWSTINTNQLVISGIANGVQPSGQGANWNGVWNWSGNAYTNSTNGIFLNNNYQSSGPFWVATNSGYNNVATPSVLFIVTSNMFSTMFPLNGQPNTLANTPFSDGTINAAPFNGQGYYPTNAFSGNPLLTYPPAFNPQPGMSNSFSLVTPEMPPFNAVGDGITDDHVAMQAAINFCASSTFNGYPLALWLPHRYFMNTNTLDITPVSGNGGLRVYGNNAALQGDTVGAPFGGALNNFTLRWTNGVVNAIVCKNGQNGTGTIFQGVHFMGPSALTGGHQFSPVGGTCAADLSTPGGSAQIIFRDCQFTFWDVCIRGTNVFDLSLYNLSSSSVSNCAIISAAQNFNMNTWNAYPLLHGLTFADGSHALVIGLDFAPGNGTGGNGYPQTNFSIVAKSGATVDVQNANFDVGGCIYNDSSVVNYISGRSGGGASIRFVITNCGIMMVGPNATILPDTNNWFIQQFNCSSTNTIMSLNPNTGGNILAVTNVALSQIIKYQWPGWR